MFRSLSRVSTSFSDLGLRLPDVEISTLRIDEKSPLVGKSLAQTELRKKYGVTVLAVRRDSRMFSNPEVDMQFYAGDVLFVLGSPEKIAGVTGLFRKPDEGEVS
ncbi:TrkA C-terminal domain-containing protein [archaeon]|nr:TrkA C-terminal domain-containing protein [archaeon]